MYSIKDIVKAYDVLVKGIEQKANNDAERAYGGIIRSGKGEVVENIAKRLVELAWSEIKGKQNRLSLEKKSVKVPLNPEYISKINCKEVEEYIREHIKEYYYTLKTDVHVYIDDNFVLGIECKAYTENAMIKRILVDFTLLKKQYKDLNCVLFQLESQLTGDYCKPSNKIIYGSPSTHTLMSYFDIDLNIITLLEGERKVDEPIHKSKYYKELKEDNLNRAKEIIKNILKKYV